jgi:hypothetical protein
MMQNVSATTQTSINDAEQQATSHDARPVPVRNPRPKPIGQNMRP